VSGGGSYGVNVALAADATNALKGDVSNGDNIAGGLKLPVWLPVLIIAAAFTAAVVWMVRSTRRKE
jgi:hypothetical protein